MNNTLTLGIMMLFSISFIHAQTVSHSFKVYGKCEMCKERIEEAAINNGAITAFWDEETDQIDITYEGDKKTVRKIEKSIVKVGHDTEKYTATQKAYDALHHCCKYREEEEEVMEEEIELELSGVVYELQDGKQVPLFGANVYWLETTEGLTTNLEGEFSVERHPGEKTLIISYVGFISDTVLIKDEKVISVVLSDNKKLKEFIVVERQEATTILKFNSIKIERLGEKELQKAACCNLSESFETNASVDVVYNDAVTGAKQIQMLGLTGPNIQITNGNIPDVRGLSSIQGLTFIPGAWIKNIFLNKGTGSVINGYESIAGQINVQLKDDFEDGMSVNAYASEGGRLEGNMSFAKVINDNWGTYVHVHGSGVAVRNDRNNDGFLDMPIGNNVALSNGWIGYNDKGWETQFGVDLNMKEHTGGQLNYKDNNEDDTSLIWGMDHQIKRVKGFAKIGRVFKDSPGKSMGLQLLASYYDENSRYGLNSYVGKQTNLYANYIFSNEIEKKGSSYQFGASYNQDLILERVNNTLFERNEIVPGVFGELTVSSIQNLTMVVGSRVDYNSIYGVFYTPRFHAKYDLNEKSGLRLSIGRGQRTPSIFAENTQLFTTSRLVIIEGDTNQPNFAYGLKPEVAWNAGLSYTHYFDITDDREGTFTVDVYRTEFTNQVVVDYENPREIRFYNLNGESFSNSFQVQLDMEIINNLDIRMAYRFFDVKTTFKNEGLIDRPLLAKHRAFFNVGYEVKGLNIDATGSWFGQKRLPSTAQNPSQLQVDNSSPSYMVFNSQLTKNWGKLDVYIGVENMFNIRQKNAIIDAENPFSQYFDASLIWGPVFGRNIYLGMRYAF